MARKPRIPDEDVLQLLSQLSHQGVASSSSSALAERLQVSPATMHRMLERLVSARRVLRHGSARATRYQSADPLVADQRAAAADTSAPQTNNTATLLDALRQPLASRTPVSYQRAFVDRYQPNSTFLLPQGLADELATLGRMKDQQPAATYARKVLDPLLIDLSWSSSHLEGNRYSRLDTEEIFKKGTSGGDLDAVMLLNHKNAIEFLVDAVPEQGLTSGVLRNLHAVLMRDLLPDSGQLGTIRQRVVNISGTVYIPSHVPTLLEEILAQIIDKARLTKNPIEAAFFLWVNIAYLQPFEDGNKRVSRLSANIPLMLYNCAPLSFMDVDRQHYAVAMLGIYEQRNAALAVELFDATYRRSIQQYAVVLESMGQPDAARIRYRESLNDAIGLIVRERKPRAAALHALNLSAQTAPGFAALLLDELQKLEEFNCARYRLTMKATQLWIAAGRPS